MRYVNELESISRPITLVTIIILIFSFIGVQILPLEESRRVILSVMLVLFGALAVLTLRYATPRVWQSRWVIYISILTHAAIIAFADYQLTMIDLAPLYTLVVIVAAIIADRPAAVFAAFVVSIAQFWVGFANGEGFGTGVVLRTAVYFLTAFLVSQLALALTKYWRVAADQAEERRTEIERRKADLEGLHEIAQAFGNLEDAPATFRQVTERTAQLLGAEICFLENFDDTRSYLQGAPPGYGLSDEQILSIGHVVDERTVAVWNVETSDFLLVPDTTALSSPLVEITRRLNLRELVAARLVVRGRAIGLILAANKLGGGSFEEKDGRLLSILARQAAIAVENARLYRETQKSLRDVTRLYAISAELLSHLDAGDIPERVVKAVAAALNAPIASIALVNETTGLLEYAATIGTPAQVLAIPFRKDGLGMTVVHSRQPRFIEDAEQNRQVHPTVTRLLNYRSVACLPIEHSNQVIGVLYVNYAEPHTFTPIEQSMLKIFANQAAIALENARLWRAERRKTSELATLANLSHLLAETLDIEEMFRIVERQVRASMPAAQAGSLFIYDLRTSVLNPRAAFGFDREILRQVMVRPGESIPGMVFQANRSMLFNGLEAIKHVQQTMEPEHQALLAAAAHHGIHPQSALGAPLRVGSTAIGVMVLDNFTAPNSFTLDDLHLLEAMADRAALAIHNARLYADETRRNAQLAVVNDVGHRITSILNLDELALTLVQLIRSKFGYRYAHLFTVDHAARRAILLAGEGPTASDLSPNGFALDFGVGMVGTVAESGVPLLANDVTREPRYLFNENIADTQSELVVPLTIGARTIGVLDAQSERVNAFEPSDIATLETLANQVAIAMENARLYSEIQEQARRDSLTQVYNHGYFAQRLTEEMERAQRENRSLALIMLDIDHFKPYNDRYGHIVGDLVLGVTVQAIRAHIKQSDFAGRWGGEEFGIVLPDANEDAACQVAERIRQTLREVALPEKDGKPIDPPTVSQGIAVFPTHAQETWRLIDLADVALYRAKAQGRDQVRVSG